MESPLLLHFDLGGGLRSQSAPVIITAGIEIVVIVIITKCTCEAQMLLLLLLLVLKS